MNILQLPLLGIEVGMLSADSADCLVTSGWDRWWINNKSRMYVLENTGM